MFGTELKKHTSTLSNPIYLPKSIIKWHVKHSLTKCPSLQYKKVCISFILPFKFFYAVYRFMRAAGDLLPMLPESFTAFYRKNEILHGFLMNTNKNLRVNKKHINAIISLTPDFDFNKSFKLSENMCKGREFGIKFWIFKFVKKWRKIAV